MNVDEIRGIADGLGLSNVGVCRLGESEHFNFFEGWLQRGNQGTMAYMAEHRAIRKDPRLLVEGARSAVVVTLNYNQPNPSVEGRPKIARYALGRDYHKVLRKKLKHLATRLHEKMPGEQFRACVDTVPLFERDLARLAGLGWFGKNTCLIDSHRGSWFFIGVILTTLEITPSTPAIGGCGTCRACIDACPTGAIVFEDGRWQLDSRRCISYLTIEHRGAISEELTDNLAGWTFGCDICQEVCPFNQERAIQPLRAAPTQEADLLQTREWPFLERLAELEFEEWDRLTAGSAVRRAGFEGLKRNALLAMRGHGQTLGTKQK